MEEPPKERALRLRRRSAKLRELGRPQYVLPHEFEEALGILRTARDGYGMSAVMIAQQVGIPQQASISRLLSGFQTGLTRPQYEKIKTLVFERPDPDQLRTGGRCNPAGTVRRVQALVEAGFPFIFLGGYLGKTRQGMQSLARPDREFVFGSTVVKITELYDKLRDTEPADYGVTADQSRRARQAAERRGFLPAHVWDDETIDDPEAHPEWTGACGTRVGRSIHKREGIPVCDACRRPVAYAPDSEDWELDAKYLCALMDRAEVTKNMLATHLGVAHGTVGTWRWGTRRPTTDKLEQIAAYFGVHVSELKL